MLDGDNRDWPWMISSLPLRQVLVQKPIGYKELGVIIEAVLKRTEWPLESDHTVHQLLRVVRGIPGATSVPPDSRGRSHNLSDPQKATQAMQNVWEKVKEASLTHGMQQRGPFRHLKALLGGGVESCTRTLTVCVGELIPFAVSKADTPPPIGIGIPLPVPRSVPLPTLYPEEELLHLGSRQAPDPIPPMLITRSATPILRYRRLSETPLPESPSPSLASFSSRMSFDPSIGQPLAGLGEDVLAPSVPVTVASSNSVADVGTQITWISSTPVKVNGPFCDVFAGTHTRVGKVALKRPRIGAAGNNEGVMRRFQREAQTWQRLRHPHILECLGSFQRDGHFYFVSPFIENGTLVEYIAVHPSVNRIRLLCETADAISYLHKKDVVHGNIKASSLLFGDNGQVLLCAPASRLTMPADVRTSTEAKAAGTLRWQSPELLEGGPESFKSDVYAFGMTIAEVLTGDVPFPDLRSDRDVINAVRIERRRPPRNPAGSSAGLSYRKVWAVAKACWRTIPEKRISMSEALQMIQEDPALTVTQADHALPAIQDITSSSLVDVGSFIMSISNDAVRLNGHFCDVFEGMHPTAGRVALKRPRIAGTGEEDATMRRFEREGIIWQRLRHPYILEFLGTFRRNQHLYLVSPFINNGTLIEYTIGHPKTNRIRLLCETADAVNYLHQNNIVHGDIKGTNILIDDNIHCRLCDFGLSKMTDSRTSTAMRGAGTSRWQSPELLEDAPKSFSSDVYAFAMTIVEVLTGEVPFAHYRNDNAVITAVFQRDERPPEKPTESPSGVSYLGAWDVAKACWSRNPEERISMFTAFQRLQADPSSSIS